MRSIIFFVLTLFSFQSMAQINDNFEGNGLLLNYTTNNPNSLPNVARVDGRYRANLVNNSDDITLHFNKLQGRLDAKIVSFPFEYIARNVGIGTQNNSQVFPSYAGNPYIFAGIQVHDLNLQLRNSSHIVVGHRGSTRLTVEGKNTVAGRSSVSDEGRDVAPEGRADLRVVGNANNTLTISWQLPNPSPGFMPDNWILYRGNGNLPGTAPEYDDRVYIGLITYAQGSRGLPFVGTSDSIEFTDLSSPVVNSNVPVAISMQYHIAQNKQKFIALAAYSDNITYLQARFGGSPIQWGTRYRDAIMDWQIESLPVNGALYFGSSVLTTAPVSIGNPDELLYVPNNGFIGSDQFSFKVRDSIGSSNVGVITLLVEQDIILPKGIPALPDIFKTPVPLLVTTGNIETDDWYIDNSDPMATDMPQANESNPRHGTPDFPRLTLPPNNASFIAGAKVFLLGGVTTPYTLKSGWHRWYVLGEPGSPVYIMGDNNQPNKPIITGDDGDQLRLQMQYAIFEGIHFKGIQVYPRAGQAGGNIVFRHSIVDKMNRGTTGSGISLNQGDNNVYYDMHIKNSGVTELDLSDENDVHGIHISRSNIWILDSLIHDSAGDAIQINGESSKGIYIGRNKLHSDNENAVDFKRRYDMIFVENDVWDYRAISYQSSGSDGVPVIVNFDTNGQAPTRSTISRNRIWDANGAIRHQGHTIWTTDNVIWQIHHNTNTTTESFAFQVGSTDENDYTDRIMNNTMSHVDAGIRIWANVNPGVIDHQYMGNIFGVLNENSLEKLHFKITGNHVQGTIIDFNNYAEPALIEWASRTQDLEWMRANTLSSVNSTENRAPLFNDAINFDLTLNKNSPLIDDNVEHAAYTEFFEQYSRSILFDVNNRVRPQGNGWDIGAYEYGVGLPSIPGNLKATVLSDGQSAQ